MVRKRAISRRTAPPAVRKGNRSGENTRDEENLGKGTVPAAEDAHDLEDDCDEVQFDPNAKDFLGDFGLDDDEAVPDEHDFWFDDLDGWED